MGRRGFWVFPLTVGVAVALTVPVGPASAVPPPNDNPANATVVNPPETLVGTLVDATYDPVEPESLCDDIDASVWYKFTAPKRGAIVIQLDARGEMDSTVDLFLKSRSKLAFEDCESTDSKGVATLDYDQLEPGSEYAIRIGKQVGSVADKFDLKVLVPSPPPTPPGKKLPAKGASGKVDRLANPGDAYWMDLQEGRTMRVNLGVRQCTSLSIYPPGTKSFSRDPVKRMNCGGYGLFTGNKTGRYSFLVEAGRSRDTQRYKLRVAPARKDDTTPGIFIGNNAKVHGKLNGGIDSTDLYRFDVTRRSTLSLSVTGGPDLKLVTESGRRMGSGSDIERRVGPGRYYVAVQGSGKYTLRRVSRTITEAWMRFNGRKVAHVSPSSSAQVQLRVRPGVAGRGVITLERFDPIDGWQHMRTVRVRVSGGSGTLNFRPPSVGRYRAYGKFLGSRTAAADDTGIAKLIVNGPLVD